MPEVSYGCRQVLTFYHLPNETCWKSFVALVPFGHCMPATWLVTSVNIRRMPTQLHVVRSRGKIIHRQHHISTQLSAHGPAAVQLADFHALLVYILLLAQTPTLAQLTGGTVCLG